MSDNLPVLYHQAKKGKIVSWKIWVEGSEVWTEYGTQDGKKQTSTKEIKGKNIGKSNETTPEEQAEREAQSTWQAKLDRKYRKTIEEAEKPLPLPMLAKKFDEKARKKISYPVDLQRKLNGVRCLAQWQGDKIELTSRSGKPYDCPHIETELETVLPKGLILDGEIYSHGKTFQEVTRLVKKIRENSNELSLWVYDIPPGEDTNTPWLERRERLNSFFEEKTFTTLTQVSTETASSEEEVFKLQAQYLTEGYEGAIVRLLDGVYRWGYRSSSLLKVKNFQDEEFKVIGYKRGVGKYIDVPIWICELPNGETFDVVSKGTMEHRAELLRDVEKYMNQMLKVQFFEYTEAGVPQFPVGLGFRMKRDMS